MKIEKIRIENFRGFLDQTIEFDDYTCMVGPNGAGKSTVLAALNVFFRQYKDSKTDLTKLSADDFHHKNVEKPIRITVTFFDLSPSASQDLSAYVRQDRLIVTSVAQYDATTGRAEVKQYGNRLGMEEFRAYFEADKAGASAPELTRIFSNLRNSFPEIPSGRTKEQMATALRSFEEENPEKLILLPSEDQFYGATRGVNRLGPHIQWIFVSAAKDITVEAEETKDSALGQLLARTIRTKVDFAGQLSALRQETAEKYEQMIGAQQGILNEVSIAIEMKLKQWSHPDATAKVQWTKDPDRAVRVDEPAASVLLGERGFTGGLARFGHGMQRSYMLTLLQELSESNQSDVPTLVMGIEEPEIYQHPPQIRYMSDLLQTLSDGGDQIIVCTHSPSFVPGDRFDRVRMIRDGGVPSCSQVSAVTYAQLQESLGPYLKIKEETSLVAKLYPSLNPVTSEMFFCRHLVLVEGIEDLAYISTALALTKAMEEFRRLGCHIVVAGMKSDIVRPLAIAKALRIPVHVVADADTNEVNDGRVTLHKRDNRCILDLLGHKNISEWPEMDIAMEDVTFWKTNITEKMKLIDGWSAHLDRARNDYGNAAGLEKNPLAIANALERAWVDAPVGFLSELCDRVLSHARTAVTA